jgi:hypothetical protein
VLPGPGAPTYRAPHRDARNLPGSRLATRWDRQADYTCRQTYITHWKNCCSETNLHENTAKRTRSPWLDVERRVAVFVGRPRQRTLFDALAAWLRAARNYPPPLDATPRPSVGACPPVNASRTAMINFSMAHCRSAARMSQHRCHEASVETFPMHWGTATRGRPGADQEQTRSRPGADQEQKVTQERCQRQRTDIETSERLCMCQFVTSKGDHFWVLDSFCLRAIRLH